MSFISLRSQNKSLLLFLFSATEYQISTRKRAVYLFLGWFEFSVGRKTNSEKMYCPHLRADSG
jgi:hypothetical protein